MINIAKENTTTTTTRIQKIEENLKWKSEMPKNNLKN